MPVSIVTLALAVRLSNHSNLQKKEKDKDLDTKLEVQETQVGIFLSTREASTNKEEKIQD
jgi:hypothetical protein